MLDFIGHAFSRRPRRLEALQALAAALVLHVAVVEWLWRERSTAPMASRPQSLAAPEAASAAVGAQALQTRRLAAAGPPPDPMPSMGVGAGAGASAAGADRAPPTATGQAGEQAARAPSSTSKADAVTATVPRFAGSAVAREAAEEPPGEPGARPAGWSVSTSAASAPPSAPAPATAAAGAQAPTVLSTATARPPVTATAAEEAEPPVVYPTQVPPPFRWSYALRRGALSGSGELSLLTDAGGYRLELRGTVLGVEVTGLSSRGGFDAAGFAPERFIDRRRGKDRLAANFDRAGQRILYSGPSVMHPLQAGTQDRLSWMVQLPAIVQAAPERFGPGARITMAVTGARGDLDRWSFFVRGHERVEVGGGRVSNALHLTREPRRPYDTRVEIWLDPTRHHLPVRASLTVLPGGETLELTWTGE